MALQVIIIGGGVAGLTAAHELSDRGAAVTVYEPAGTNAPPEPRWSQVADSRTVSSAANVRGCCIWMHAMLSALPQTRRPEESVTSNTTAVQLEPAFAAAGQSKK